MRTANRPHCTVSRASRDFAMNKNSFVRDDILRQGQHITLPATLCGKDLLALTPKCFADTRTPRLCDTLPYYMPVESRTARRQ